MMIGIRAHDLVTGNIKDVLTQAEDYGLDAIQLVFKKALKQDFNEENALIVKEELKHHNIKIAMLGAYFNPVHSNSELVRKNVEYFKEHLRLASLLDCKYVGTETGSYNDDKWTYNPKNQTEEGYQQTMKVFHELASVANKYKTTILMEPAWGHVIFDIDQLERAVKEINSDYFKVTIDLYNLMNLHKKDFTNYKETFTKALKTFKDDVKIIHLKDFYLEGDGIKQCGLGKGIIDFKFIVDTAKKYSPNATLIFEGVVGEDIISSKKLIDSVN